METRASHLLIGSFVLLFIGGIFGFAIWLAGTNIDDEFSYYRVKFREAVSGLSIGGDVRYRGIKIGRVSAIDVDTTDPQNVAVDVEINRKYKIREGDVATLNYQGVTGIAFVNIQGASADNKELLASKKSTLPVIPSKASSIEQFMHGAPNLIAQGTILAERFSDIFNDDNRELVNSILIGVNSLMISLGNSSEKIERVMNTAERASQDIAQASASISKISGQASTVLTHIDETVVSTRNTVDGANQIFQNDIKQLVASLKETTESINKLSDDTNLLLDENRESLHDFASEGLNEFTRFVSEARLMVASLARVVDRFESEGTRFLFQNQESEYRPK